MAGVPNFRPCSPRKSHQFTLSAIFAVALENARQAAKSGGRAGFGDGKKWAISLEGRTADRTEGVGLLTAAGWRFSLLLD